MKAPRNIAQTLYYEGVKVLIKKQNRSCKVQVTGETVHGLDTETVDGLCRLICDSSGHSLFPQSFLELARFLHNRRFRNSSNLFYNLRYDFQSIIKWIDDREVLKELWDEGEADYRGFHIKYIPEKFFSLTRNKHVTCFFDISQFYEKMSLKRAAEIYLDDKKGSFDVSNMTLEKILSDECLEYCKHDAFLTKGLGVLFLSKMSEMGIAGHKLFSAAYLAEKWFTSVADVPVTDKLPKGAIGYAMQSYRGGWFETAQRGYFKTAHLYDINSAYPFHIAQLIDVTKGHWVFKRNTIPQNAYYGYMRCRIEVSPKVHLSPISVKFGDLAVYPAGKFERVITYEEYKFLNRTSGFSVKLFNGWYFIPNKIIYPFKEAIMLLYGHKLRLKEKDPVLYLVVKRLLNSLYGKFWQKRFDSEGSIITGNLFCAMYASEITSRTRLQIARAIKNPREIIAVATDSILTRKKLKLPLSQDLGEWSYEKGQVISVMSGLYSVKKGKKTVTKKRGFEEKFNFFDLAKQYPKEKKIPITVSRVLSLGNALRWTRKYKLSDMNCFLEVDKSIDLNGDLKRVWPKSLTMGQLARVQQKSLPVVISGELSKGKRRRRKKKGK